MSYRLALDAPLEAEFRRVAKEMLDSALDELADDQLNAHRKVHSVRKRCKKLRALARLVRGSFGGYRQANATIRDASRRLSELRDAKVRVDSLDQLIESQTTDAETALEETTADDVRRALVTHRDATLGVHLVDEGRLEAVRADLEAIRATIGDWQLPNAGFEAVASGFARTYRRAQRAMTLAAKEPDAEHFHAWRKRVKYHRYHLELLADLWPTPLWSWQSRLHQLTDHLGIGNDLSELARADEALAAADEPGRQRLVAAVEDRRKATWQQAHELGDHLLTDSVDLHLSRLQALWPPEQAL